MTDVADTIDRVEDRVRGAAGEMSAEYGREDEPLGGYVGITTGYAALLAGLAGLVRWRKVRLPDRLTPGDLALIAVATHKASRTIAKDSVLSPVRAPFTRFKGAAGPGEVNEEVRGTGVRKAVGELVTCPFCLDQWVATAFVAGLVVAPRATRLLASAFAARTGADFLQFAYAAVEQGAER